MEHKHEHKGEHEHGGKTEHGHPIAGEAHKSHDGGKTEHGTELFPDAKDDGGDGGPTGGGKTEHASRAPKLLHPED